MHSIPQKQGLYDPRNEHDACGVGLVIDIQGTKSRQIIETGLRVLVNMSHRGAEGADHKSGDGAGIMVQIPHEFILLQEIPVPEKGRYGTGLVFLPKDKERCEGCLDIIRGTVVSEGLSLMHVRDVPVDRQVLGETARETEPDIKQIFITGNHTAGNLPVKLYALRRKIEQAVAHAFPDDPKCCYIVSLSSTNLVYKGMLSSGQLGQYFTDLQNPYFTSGIALVHSRFSTNTFPTWDLAQPFRLIGHNGEINTIKGNRSWMQTRESLLRRGGTDGTGEPGPIVQPGMSDSASLDNVIEFFVMNGMSLPHALAMLVPESYNARNPIPEDLKGFYEYHSIWMEPWDGPAAILFSDGRYAGGMLDRNGLRPGRYIVTTNGMMVIASETGVTGFPEAAIREKGRLRPGKMVMVDTHEGRILFDREIKAELAAGHPYRQWLRENRIVIDQVTSGRKVSHRTENYGQLLKTFGYTAEQTERIIKPMAATGHEPLYSMGNDTPLAILSKRPQRLFDYFRQKFAQVTNPPIDPLREELVMSLAAYIGAVDGDLLLPSPQMCKVVKLTSPVLTNRSIDILRNLRYKGFRTHDVHITYCPHGGGRALEEGILNICHQVEAAVDDGCNYIILTDRGVNESLAPIPSLMALSAVHHYLIKKRKRAQIALIVETGEAREIMHMALLIGYGASAVNPYMAFAVLGELVENKEIQLDYATAEKNYVQAVDKGMLKVMSKMGISTIRSYRGAKLFDCVGLSRAFTERYFEGTSSPLGGAGVEEIAAENAAAHLKAFQQEGEAAGAEGIYAYRRGGEKHAWNPEAVKALQTAARNGDFEKYRRFASLVNPGEPSFIRDLVELPSDPIDIALVEPAESILRRFVSGAMSYGSISMQAHRDITMAMNAIGGRSNTGEGGEPATGVHEEDGCATRNAVKQVASGRFGVTTGYLADAQEIQIKVAQGAKPGEGGQLPGYKVDEMIARTRHSTPGITLISPPPHHDIYSIEDLSQLIFDLRNVNPDARISVKLVSESGVGTVAAGVAKAKADVILISGGEGGTGASPISSVRHAGLPLEIGLSETQQTLVLNNLRGDIILQADGQFKTGRDVVVSAMLGAEEFGFSTSLMVALGCVMDRKCHLNTCPVGIATQDPDRCSKYKGDHRDIENYLRFVAEDVREHLAAMGARSLEEITGRADLLRQEKPARCATGHRGFEQLVNDPEALHAAKISSIDLSALFHAPGPPTSNAIKNCGPNENILPQVPDFSIVRTVGAALDKGESVSLERQIRNTDRSVGAYLSGRVIKKIGGLGLPPDTIKVAFDGSAGQSFGAFLCNGITFVLRGDTNDYLAKGLSGGKIAVMPAEGTPLMPENNIIAGNTLLYGVTSGEVYINGQVGERFCVRNSGATAVAEGTGDHCCEYMTGGTAVILGPTGRNFAAGMSGGVAYVWDPDGKFDFYCNMEMVELSLLEESGDEETVRRLIGSHYRHTASPLARRMLDNWSLYCKQFLKVIPIEYKSILAARREESSRTAVGGNSES